MERIPPRALELVPYAAVEGIERGAAGQLVGRPRADLPAIDGRAAVLVFQDARGRLRDRVGERHVLGPQLGIALLRPQEEHTGRSTLHKHGQRHR